MLRKGRAPASSPPSAMPAPAATSASTLPRPLLLAVAAATLPALQMGWAIGVLNPLSGTRSSL
jgi:hypothetical protein